MPPSRMTTARLSPPRSSPMRIISAFLAFALLSLILLTLVAPLPATTASDDDESVFGVDAAGNLHINTSTSNTTVFFNGRDVYAEVSALRVLLSEQASTTARLTDTLSSLASQQDRLLSRLSETCGTVTFSEEKVVASDIDGPTSVTAADIDGDGDLDVVSASFYDDTVAWYENADGKGMFLQRIITSSANTAYSVFAADVDGDGDMDVVCASSVGDEISWFENEDGNGSFSAQNVISTSANFARSVFAADLDGDDDVDVLSASLSDDKIAWYENENGFGNFSTQRIISASTNGAFSVFAADLDGDGDMDVLGASPDDDEIVWFENINGLGAFSEKNVITTSANGARSVIAADVDGDGDMDVLSASSLDDKITWHENQDGLGTFSEQKVISNSTNEAYAVFAADLDGDGDLDVLSASRFDGEVAWFENEDGLGSFSHEKIITTNAGGVHSVFAADFDGDGDVDVVVASTVDDKIVWHENLCA